MSQYICRNPKKLFKFIALYGNATQSVQPMGEESGRPYLWCDLESPLGETGVARRESFCAAAAFLLAAL